MGRPKAALVLSPEQREQLEGMVTSRSLSGAALAQAINAIALGGIHVLPNSVSGFPGIRFHHIGVRIRQLCAST
jgi:hypothetical protein